LVARRDDTCTRIARTFDGATAASETLTLTRWTIGHRRLVVLFAAAANRWRRGSRSPAAYLGAALPPGAVFVFLAHRLRRTTCPRRAARLFH
jgi:hypothetical protein